MNLDIGKAFTYVSEDPKWVTKVLIGGGLVIAGFVTLVGWIFTLPVVGGYLILLLRNVIAGQPQPLPEWDNWGERWIDGFKAWVVGLVYAIPGIVISIIFNIPASILNSSSNNGASGVGTLLSLTGSCLNFIVSIAVALVLPVAIARYAVSSDIGNALQFGAVIATVRANIATFAVIALLNAFVVPLLAGIGIIACFIGAAFTGFYAYLMIYHLYGQAYRQTQGAATGMGQPPQPSYPF
jgi:hypothetical protein